MYNTLADHSGENRRESAEVKGSIMIWRKEVGIITACFVVCLTTYTVFAAKSVASKNTVRNEVKTSETHGGGESGTSSHRISDVAVKGQEGVNKSSKTTVPTRKPVKRNRHIMAAPKRFPKDGVYIWCDPDGVWTMFWRGEKIFAVKAIVSAEEPITIRTAVKAKTSVLKTGTNQLEISSLSKTPMGVVRFDSAAESVQFTVLVNGKPTPDRVYIGSRFSNPEQFPMELKTRRRLPTKAMLGLEPPTIKDHEKQVGTGIDTAAPIKERPISVVSHGGSAKTKNSLIPKEKNDSK